MRVLICGDRNWNNSDMIKHFILSLPNDTVIIHGGCRGADIIAGTYALSCGLIVLVFQADWKKYGKSAGPIRNKRMIDEGKPDLVIAFHNDIEHSKGTKNMLKQAKEAGIYTAIINEVSDNRSL